jgi:hypothetical protein
MNIARAKSGGPAKSQTNSIAFNAARHRGVARCAGARLLRKAQASARSRSCPPSGSTIGDENAMPLRKRATHPESQGIPARSQKLPNSAAA